MYAFMYVCRFQVNTNLDFKLLAQLAVHLQMNNGIGIHALDSQNCSLFNYKFSEIPSEHRSGSPVKLFFKVIKKN